MPDIRGPRTIEALLELHEAYRSKVYRCPAGYLTVGIGRNLETRGLSRDEAEYLLKNDIAFCEYQLAMRSYWSRLDEVRKAVCIDLMFNLGAKGYSGFVRYERALETGNYPLAAQELRNSKWFRQVGRRGPRLVEMMESGCWPKHA